MLKPLILLALGAIFVGAIDYTYLGFVSPHAENAFFQNTIANYAVLEEAHHVPGWVKVLPLLVAIAGIIISWVFYIVNPKIPSRIAEIFPWSYKFLLNKWYFDEFYDWLFVRRAKKIGLILWKFWDEKIIDGLGPNGAAVMTTLSAGRVSRLQTGFVYHYAFAMMIGFMIIVGWVVFGV
jgi:NADH-quinone oxidoreductase subunit L